MNLLFDMTVVDSDGLEVGKLDRVLVDPARRQLTHIVIGSSSLHAEVLVPLSLVHGSVDRCLLLHSARGALDNMPLYELDRTGLPPFHRVVIDGVRETEDLRETLEEALELTGRLVELGTETRVSALNEPDTQLVGMAADDTTHCLSEIIVHGFGQSELVVPAQWLAYEPI
jgi:hypothetical protein